MTTHFQREIEDLKKELLSLGAKVEESVRNSVRALTERDAALAQRVVENDTAIDDMDVAIEEECLKILALYQPVAVDLRFLVSALKINNDLERIGDLAVNIAERAEWLSSQPPADSGFDFVAMAEKTQWMLQKTLDAFVKVDPKLAREVRKADDEVDTMNRRMYTLVEQGVQKHPDRVAALIQLLSVSRHLERIADLATNIAEDVVYLAEGAIVRHNRERTA